MGKFRQRVTWTFTVTETTYPLEERFFAPDKAKGNIPILIRDYDLQTESVKQSIYEHKSQAELIAEEIADSLMSGKGKWTDKIKPIIERILEEKN